MLLGEILESIIHKMFFNAYIKSVEKKNVLIKILTAIPNGSGFCRTRINTKIDMAAPHINASLKLVCPQNCLNILIILYR